MYTQAQYLSTDGFNPRPHERGDRQLAGRGRTSGRFNPRPHERGDLYS